MSAFYADLKRNGVSEALTSTVISLANQLNTTIRKMPMYYIGRSISSDYHSIFKPDLNRKSLPIKELDSNYLVMNYGTFSIPKAYYEAFEILGSFISGQDSIFLKWAEFSKNASKQTLSIENILGNLVQAPVTERDSRDSKDLFDNLLKKLRETECVWTGRKTDKIEVDHIIPLAIWKNNDLWNLLPAVPKINNTIVRNYTSCLIFIVKLVGRPMTED
ncbi:MAG: HNH endonuclease signature motif containing protein [Algoriphagus aquaeductus]|uniref:HNH endonuclease signature motif containing protein n=1 Tax=Algoriphagus aquaeductus TaxID=475299 RepID=UPI003918F6EF